MTRDRYLALVSVSLLLVSSGTLEALNREPDREVNRITKVSHVATEPVPTPTPTLPPSPPPPTPPPAPVSTPASRSRLPAVPQGSVAQRIAAAWPGDDAKVLRVVSCETGGTFNPNIRSRSGRYWGLFQADASFRAAYGYGPSVEEQAAMAWRGFQARGWRPWPKCGRL